MTHEPNFVFTTIRAEMAARLARKEKEKAKTFSALLDREKIDVTTFADKRKVYKLGMLKK